MDDRLPFGQRLGLRMHLMMCAVCRRYKRQLLLMRRMFRALPAEDRSRQPLFKLDEDVKLRLRQLVDSHLADEGR
jgi:hypothetical protein